MTPELHHHLGRRGQVAVEQVPRLEVGRRAGKREAQLPDMAADAALGRPGVLQRLDVEQKPDRARAQAVVLVAVTIATVSVSGSRSSICSSIVSQEVASFRWTSVRSSTSQPAAARRAPRGRRHGSIRCSTPRRPRSSVPASRRASSARASASSRRDRRGARFLAARTRPFRGARSWTGRGRHRTRHQCPTPRSGR